MDLTNNKILLIEDSDVVATLETAILQSSGYIVQHAATAAEGLNLIRDWHPDLLILDIKLPDMDGLSVLRQIGEKPKHLMPDVIVLSGHDDPEVTYECLKNGAHDFIRKPFQNEEFLLRVGSLRKLREYRIMSEALKDKMNDDLRKLSRYFSRDIIGAILDGSLSTDPGGDLMTATFMMFDLRGSTTIAERLGPEKFFVFLSELFSDITDLIVSNGGVINKFTGDGFLVTFGLRNYSQNATLDAMKCAFKIRDHFELYNQVRPSKITEELGFGIGITTGEVFAGNIGNVHKMEYTILGDPVNLSARLESLTKKANVDILIDGETRDILAENIETRPVRVSEIRGKLEKVRIYHPVRSRAEGQSPWLGN